MSVQKRYHHGDLARTLVLAARKRIETEGADGLSLRGLAREAGVDPAATYRHFKSKEDLLIQVAAEGFNALAHAMENAMQGHVDAKARLVEVGVAYVAYGIRNPKLFALMFDLAGRASGAALKDRVETNPYDIFVACVQAVLPDVEDTRRALLLAHLWSNVHGAVGLANQGLLFQEDKVGLSGPRKMCEAVVDMLAQM